MSDEAAKSYPAYTTFKVRDDKSEVFHLCATHERAMEWHVQHRAKADEKPETGGPGEHDNDGERSEGFQLIIDNYLKSIKSFYDVVNINSSIRVVFQNMFIDKEFDDFRKESLDHIETDEDYLLYGVPEDLIGTVARKFRRFDHLKEGIRSLPSSILLGVVARFDANISSLVRFMLVNKKERLAASSKQVSVSKIISAQSFDELVNDLVDDEIHALMRGSHEEQIQYIESNFSIEIAKGFKRWPEFIELFERRNLTAHGEGFANARYDRVCERVQVPTSNRLKLGQPIKLGDGYLRQSVDLLLEFGILLIWWLWLKNEAENVEKAYAAINSVTYDLIFEKRYRVAARILNSALERKSKNAPETLRRMMAVNLANCYKKMQDDKAFNKALELFDWTASADEYKISVASLRGNVEEVCALMPRVMDDEAVGKSGFREWPVFDWVREEAVFQEKFLDTFGEALDILREKKATPAMTIEDTDSESLGS